MIIKKVVRGKIITLDISPIKEYKNFTLYQISRIEKLGKQIKLVPLYKESYTPSQLQEIKDKNYFIREEVFS